MSAASLARLNLDQARDALLAGELIVFPTETFYGLGCDAMNADAVGAVFSLKKRPLAMPLPVVVNSRAMLERLSPQVPETAALLMDAFWPGPLSIILPANPEVPDLLTANVHRVAVRCSPHPAVLDLCRATDRVLVASSANISGRPPAARLQDLDPELLEGIAGVYDTGPEPAGGLPSTVVDIRDTPDQTVVRVRRAGAVTAEALRRAGFLVHEEDDARQDQ